MSKAYFEVIIYQVKERNKANIEVLINLLLKNFERPTFSPQEAHKLHNLRYWLLHNGPAKSRYLRIYSHCGNLCGDWPKMKVLYVSTCHLTFSLNIIYLV